ncbi:MAG: FtsX-like permease family protein [Bacteroidota bacterium]
MTLQFTAAISLMICTAFVYQQLQFIKAKSLGFEKENILTLTYYPALQTKYNSFRQALLQSPDIAYVSRSSHIPSSQLLNDVYASPQSNPNDSVAVKGVLIKELGIDMDFMATYGVPLMAGRNFSPQYGQDENAAYLINKKACDLLGWAEPAQAIDQALNIRGVNGRIIGVVDDFHFESLHEEIKPTLFNLPGAENYFKIAVKVKGNQVAPAIAYLKKTWKEFLPEAPFAYSFLDEKFEKLYLAEKRVGGLFFAFTGLAIGIACLGLFGLISFVSQQRTKEIGIRKVLGAQLLHLFALLSKSYLLLISLAIGIAFIITSLVISEWLKNFAYHIDLLDHWYIFMFSGLVALLITGFTLSLQILKVARLNPIDTLRSE